MPYEKNLTKKKFLQINKKQLKTIPNMKQKDFKHISNQQMLAGIILEASDPISKNPDFGQFQSLKTVLLNFENFFQKLMNRKSFGPFCQDMRGVHLSRKESSLNIHASPDLIPPPNNFHLSVPGKSQKSMHMPYEENLTNKKYLQINKKQLKTIPNIKGRHFKHFSN